MLGTDVGTLVGSGYGACVIVGAGVGVTAAAAATYENHRIKRILLRLSHSLIF